MEYKVTFKKFQEGLRDGRFLGTKCKGCGSYNFPPQGICLKCNGSDIEMAEMGGKGIIRTFTVIRVAPEGMKPPYVLALVELEEGAWTVGQLVGIDPEGADMGLLGKEVNMGSQPVLGVGGSEDEPYILTFSTVTN